MPLRPCFSRLQSLSLLLALIFFAGPHTVSADASQANPAFLTDGPVPRPNPKAQVVQGRARFTVITPTLIRLEYAPDGQFEDRRSYFAVERNVAPPPFRVTRAGKSLTLATSAMTLRYKDDGTTFSADDLRITFTDLRVTPHAAQTWKPGMTQTGNLGGTLRTLDGATAPRGLGEGLLSRDGWYLLDDRRPLLTNDAQPWLVSRPNNGATDWYFFGYGHDYAQALRDLTTIGGPVPLPSRYTLGAYYSRYWPYTGDDYRQIVQEFTDHRFPLDDMVMDMDWHKDGWTGYTWNPKLLPDAPQLLSFFHQQGLHITLNLHPHDGVGRQEEAFPAFAAALGLDPSKTHRIPFQPENPQFVRNYFDLLHHPREREGVDFWWMDWQQATDSPVPGGDALPWLNLLHFRDRARPETGLRGQAFSRWAGWGDHRHPIEFSGDVQSNWDMLRFEVPFTATAGNVGCFYWSHDIGGHWGTRPIPELFTRWAQFGAMSAALRPHSTRAADNDRRPWLYGPAAEDALRRAYDLRARMFPYIYSAARLCYDTSAPLLRPMYFGSPTAEAAYRHPGQYLFGPDVLVAPVVAPGDGAASLASSVVWFPEGPWFNVFTGERVAGTGEQPVRSALADFPVFVRGGVPLPMQPMTLRMTAPATGPLVVQAYPGPRGAFTLYEDDGESAGYQTGKFARTPLTQTPHPGGSVDITVGPTVGTFRGQRSQRGLVVRLPQTSAPNAVLWNGRPLGRSGPNCFSYDPQTVTTQVTLGAASIRRPVRLTVRFPVPPADILPALTARLALAVHALAGAAPEAPWRPGLVVWRDRLLALRAQWGMGGNVRATRAGIAEADKTSAAMAAGLALRTDPQAQWARQALLDLGLRLSPEGDVSGALTAEATLGPTRTDVRSCRVNVDLAGTARFPVTTAPLSGPGVTRVRLPLTTQADRAGRLTATLRLTASGSHGTQTLTRAVRLDGILSRWSVVGPFPGGHGPKERAEAPEQKLDLTASYVGKGGKTIRWQTLDAPRHWQDADVSGDVSRLDRVNLNALYPEQDASAYAVTYLEADRAMEATLFLRSDDGARLWLNGQEVFDDEKPRTLAEKEDRIPIHLKAGENELLLKVDQGSNEWEYRIALVQPEGLPLLRQSATPQSAPR